ncbi:MAG: arginine N-succinyltransferase [Pontixanthobacter sp.]
MQNTVEPAVTGDRQANKTVPSPMLRMANANDLESLYDLAVAGGDGLTNLPPDRTALAAKLAASEQALISSEAREEGAAILMIVELDGQVAATCCVFPKVGANWPFYSYRVTRQVSRSLAIGKRKVQTLLNLVNDFDGECEVGGLFVGPEFRGLAIGKLAAKARYLFIATHRDWFGRKVIAELRGFQDQRGNSPVWEAIGRHFYDMNFSEADRTGALAGNQFIADLGPRYPLYISMLPENARDALGKPHDDGRAALQMLVDEGFDVEDYIDIFDGGPTVVCDIDKVRSVRESCRTTVNRIETDLAFPKMSLVASGSGAQFRVARGTVDSTGCINHALAKTLTLRPGDAFVHIPI